MKLHRHLLGVLITTLREILAEGRHAGTAVDQALKSHPKWGSRDRRQFAGTLYDLVRWHRLAWYLAGLDDQDYLEPTALTEENLWRTWTAWHLHQGHEPPPFEECHGLDANSVARRAAELSDPAIRASIPDWLEEQGKASHGESWENFRKSLNDPAPVFLRGNSLQTSPDRLRARLESEGILTDRVTGHPLALKLRERKNLQNIPAYQEGWFEVQDIGSQKLAPFLQVEPHMKVIDACAGAGGKALHLASLMGNEGRILAMDIHAHRLAELERRAQRAGATRLRTRTIANDEACQDLVGSADRVLLDVPCSGLGVLRRDPDTKWRMNPAKLAELVIIQRQILEQYSRFTRPGGKCVYATCSVLAEENENQVRQFLAANPNQWTLEEELHLAIGQDEGDGYYAARLLRHA